MFLHVYTTDVAQDKMKGIANRTNMLPKMLPKMLDENVAQFAPGLIFERFFFTKKRYFGEL